MLEADGVVLAHSGGANNGINNDGAGLDINTQWMQLAPDSTGGFINGMWSPAASMNTARLFFPSNILANGDVFVAGGEFSAPADTYAAIPAAGARQRPEKPQRKPKKPAPASKEPKSTAELHRALTGRKKVELVDILLQLAQADRGVLRHLTARFDVAAAPAELVAATRQAIADATNFDERDINRNFDYDYEAYQAVTGKVTVY